MNHITEAIALDVIVDFYGNTEAAKVTLRRLKK